MLLSPLQRHRMSRMSSAISKAPPAEAVWKKWLTNYALQTSGKRRY
jgi:hypothetical protein